MLARFLAAFAALLFLNAAGVPQGSEVIEHHANGQVHIQYTTNSEGQKHGNYSEFSEDGTLLVKARYAEDQLDGRELRYHPSGERHVVATWRKGILNGRYERFYENGNSEISTGYKKGVESGKFTRQSEDGERVLKGSHKAGLLDGSLKVKDHGKTISQQKWKAGVPLLINGVVPFPRTRRDLIQELSGVWQAPKPADDVPELEADRQAGLRRLQTFRALCGLRYKDMTLHPEWNELCQAAAVVCKALGTISHTPEHPPGIDDETYAKGAKGAISSNLSMGGSIGISIDRYMDDSSQRNIDRVGHRRWCLNPAMKLTGFGRVDRTSAMWSIDASGKVETKQSAVLYPPPGYVPVQMCVERAAWSISPISGSLPDKDKVQITLQPLGEYYLPTGKPLRIDTTFVSTTGMGSGPCLIFRSDAMEVAAGKAYLCQVSLNEGKSMAYEYIVEFVDEPGLANK